MANVAYNLEQIFKFHAIFALFLNLPPTEVMPGQYCTMLQGLSVTVIGTSFF